MNGQSLYINSSIIFSIVWLDMSMTKNPANLYEYGASKSLYQCKMEQIQNHLNIKK